MTDEDTPGPLSWPERWSTSKDAPPLGRAFVDTIEKPSLSPVVRQAAPVTPSLRRIGPAVAMALAVASVVLWRMTPPTHVNDIPALLPVDEPVPSEVRPSTVAEAEAAHSETLDDAAGAAGNEPTLPEWVARAAEVGAEPPDLTHGRTEPASRVATGRVHVSSIPWAEMSIDGEPRGPTPRWVTLPAGTHTIRLTRASAGVDYSSTFEVRAGETTRVAFDARPPADPTARPTPPPAPAATFEGSRYDAARACAIAGDHSCVIRELRGHCTAAREYELLIVAMRARSGFEREVESTMRAYLTRFPTARQAAAYRQYLVAHSGD